MEILCFKVIGKFAHFRKYYANNTALSFTIPPRTTMMGIVAAVMGWEKDSYYDLLSSDNIHFAIRVITPLKKSFHRLNFLSLKSLGDIAKKEDSDFRGSGGRIQTPFEIVSGYDLRKDEVIYQIFIKSANVENEVFNKIKTHFLTDNPVFNVSLGIANFIANIRDVSLISNYTIEHATHDFMYIHSAVQSENIIELNFNKETSNYNFVEEDLFPAEFVKNGNRELKSLSRLIFSITDLPLNVRLSGCFYKINLDSVDLNIVFVDE